MTQGNTGAWSGGMEEDKMRYDLCLTEQSVTRETEKAVCFTDGSRERWVPKKILTWRDHGKAYLPTAEVPLWFAKQNGMMATGRDIGH